MGSDPIFSQGKWDLIPCDSIYGDKPGGLGRDRPGGLSRYTWCRTFSARINNVLRGLEVDRQKIPGKDDLAGEVGSAGTNKIGLVAGWVEVGKE